MPRYLIDVNLPYYFSLWRGEQYIHQKDIDDELSDSQIWTFAQANNLVIVTKDTDFSNRILLKEPPPRVVLIAFGNLKMRPFYERISACWVDRTASNAVVGSCATASTARQTGVLARWSASVDTRNAPIAKFGASISAFRATPETPSLGK